MSTSLPAKPVMPSGRFASLRASIRAVCWSGAGLAGGSPCCPSVAHFFGSKGNPNSSEAPVYLSLVALVALLFPLKVFHKFYFVIRRRPKVLGIEGQLGNLIEKTYFSRGKEVALCFEKIGNQGTCWTNVCVQLVSRRPQGTLPRHEAERCP